MADARDSKSLDRKVMRVRLSPRALDIKENSCHKTSSENMEGVHNVPNTRKGRG